MTEIWKDILGYEGLYQVSSTGRVKSVEKVDLLGHKRKEHIMSLSHNRGYLNVNLFDKEGIRKTFRVHRLVAIAFIQNPNNKPEVNHINGIPSDNAVHNLEWVTSSENQKHAVQNNLQLYKSGSTHHAYKGPIQVYKDGVYVTSLHGRKELEAFGLDSSSVSKCLSQKQKTHKGFTFERSSND